MEHGCFYAMEILKAIGYCVRALALNADVSCSVVTENVAMNAWTTKGMKRCCYGSELGGEVRAFLFLDRLCPVADIKGPPVIIGPGLVPRLPYRVREFHPIFIEMEQPRQPDKILRLRSDAPSEYEPTAQILLVSLFGRDMLRPRQRDPTSFVLTMDLKRNFCQAVARGEVAETPKKHKQEIASRRQGVLGVIRIAEPAGDHKGKTAKERGQSSAEPAKMVVEASRAQTGDHASARQVEESIVGKVSASFGQACRRPQGHESQGRQVVSRAIQNGSGSFADTDQ